MAAPSADNRLTAEQLVAELVRLLDVAELGEDRFEGARKHGGIGRVFGGQVIAQALSAAQRTIGEDRPVHSLHAYFLRGGSEDHAIGLQVRRDFDGGSFSNRRVIASQEGRPILTLTAGFQRDQPGLHHQAPAMPKVPPPEEIEPDEALRLRLAGGLNGRARDFALLQWPIETRSVGGPQWALTGPREPLACVWFRAAAKLPDDPRLHRAALAYASDMQLLGTALQPHGKNFWTGQVKLASLDHALWFHEDFRADEWLLYATESPWSGGSRGFARGQIFDREGKLVVSVCQEGMVRET